jgi:hypothetical protein
MSFSFIVFNLLPVENPPKIRHVAPCLTEVGTLPTISPDFRWSGERPKVFVVSLGLDWTEENGVRRVTSPLRSERIRMLLLILVLVLVFGGGGGFTVIAAGDMAGERALDWGLYC